MSGTSKFMNVVLRSEVFSISDSSALSLLLGIQVRENVDPDVGWSAPEQGGFLSGLIGRIMPEGPPHLFPDTFRRRAEESAASIQRTSQPA